MNSIIFFVRRILLNKDYHYFLKHGVSVKYNALKTTLEMFMRRITVA